MSPVSSATLALLTTLALSTPDSRAHAQACAVSGSGLRMSSVRVAAGPSSFVVHVDPVDVEATPPRAAGARTPIVVRGAVRFEGSVDPSELPYVVREGVEAGGGVLRIGTRLAFDVSSVRASAGRIRATLSDGRVRFSDVALPCDALELQSPDQRDTFRQAFANGRARPAGSGCVVDYASLQRAADEGVRAHERARGTERRAYFEAVSDRDDAAGRVMLRGTRALVRVSPERREGLRVTIRRPREVPFEVVERRPGWTRVRLGWDDGSELEGWIASRRLVPWVPPPAESGPVNLGGFGHGGGGRGPDGLVGPAQIRIGAPIHVTPGGPIWATVETSESFTVHYEPAGEWIAIFAIPGLRFASAPSAWVAREHVTLGVSEARGLSLRQPTSGALSETTFERVDEGSPAHAAGLRSGDRIVRIEGAPADAHVGLDELRILLARGMRLSIEREGRRIAIDLPTAPGCHRDGSIPPSPSRCCPW